MVFSKIRRMHVGKLEDSRHKANADEAHLHLKPYWDEVARREELDPLSMAIDPGDLFGRKNLYVSLINTLALEQELQFSGEEIVLDFGTGTGRLAQRMMPFVRGVVAIDISRHMLVRAKALSDSAGILWLRADGAHIPLTTSSVDRVFSVYTLQGFMDRDFTHSVHEMARCCRGGGRVILLEQAAKDGWGGHRRRRQPSEYVAAFESVGFTVCSHDCIRWGKHFLLYAIRYGLIPKRWLPCLAAREVRRRRQQGLPPQGYGDCLFVFEKGMGWP
jgi:SAM-dependent methyltransferase